MAFVCGLISTAVLAAPACAGGSESAARPAAPKIGAKTIPAHDEASFNAAIAQAAAGDTIQLADGSYPTLTVGGRSYQSPVRIVGSRNAKLAGILFLDSANVVLVGVTITPPAEEMAKIGIRESSRNIVIDGVLVDGRDERVGAAIVPADNTSDVTVRNSELRNCGRGGGCVRLGAKNLRILENKFVDCRSCDFIKGGGQGALVQGNTFDLAHNVDCKGGPASCPHNNLIHIMGGGSWTIVGNRFGEAKAGSGQIYVNPTVRSGDNPIRELLIASNIFTGDTGMGIRIGIGQKSPAPPPRNVRIVNNTILSGRLTSVMLVIPWAQLPVDQRPLVANNIMRKVNPGNCGRGRFASNLVLQGAPCPGDAAGDPKLDAKTAAPTAQSSLVVDKGDPRYAPKTDFHGNARNGVPDRGAVELRGRSASPLRLTVPATVGRRAAALARNGWRLEVALGLSGAETLRARLLMSGRLLTSVSARVTGKTRHTLVVPVPVTARRPGVLVLRLDASAGSGSVSRSVTVRILG